SVVSTVTFHLSFFFFFFSSRRRHTRSDRDWSSDVCSSDLAIAEVLEHDARDPQLAGPALDEKGLACADPSGDQVPHRKGAQHARSEERRVGKEGRRRRGREARRKKERRDEEEKR